MLAISMLAEGTSIRSIERMTNVHRDTVMHRSVMVGKGCQRIVDAKVRGLSCQQIEIDEIGGFIGTKRKNAACAGVFGDVWTFIALDVDTKLIPTFVVGKRNAYHAKAIMSDLAGRLLPRVQVSSNSLRAYMHAAERAFGSEVDYGQIAKTNSFVTVCNAAASVRYSPAEVVKTEKTVVCGMPDMNRICTSHVQGQNLTLRMRCRRLARLTNAFSRKLENFQAAVAPNSTYYNFCKRTTL